ncbi:MAG: ATP-binding protein, partial [Alphaproteobacteria bacterium]
EKSGDAYILIISDTGIGVPPAAMDLMSSVPPEKSQGDGKPAGNGLGLPITRRIVESLGGILEFRSSPVGGTVVTLRFPSDPTKKRTAGDV